GCSFIRRFTAKDQLEALVAQMYKSGILYSEAVREFKKRFLLTVLAENHGNQCKAARELGMHRNTLSRTINELKLDVQSLREDTRRPPRGARAPLRRDRAAGAQGLGRRAGSGVASRGAALRNPRNARWRARQNARHRGKTRRPHGAARCRSRRGRRRLRRRRGGRRGRPARLA